MYGRTLHAGRSGERCSRSPSMLSWSRNCGDSLIQGQKLPQGSPLSGRGHSTPPRTAEAAARSRQLTAQRIVCYHIYLDIQWGLCLSLVPGVIPTLVHARCGCVLVGGVTLTATSIVGPEVKRERRAAVSGVLKVCSEFPLRYRLRVPT